MTALSGSSPDNEGLPYKPVLNQKIEADTYIEHPSPSLTPSAIRELTRLSGVSGPEHIGELGPPQAARSTETNQHLAEQALYQEVYPRDAFVSAGLLWSQYPRLTEATVLASLPHIGLIDNLNNLAWIDEQEVGKIPHQIRDKDHPRSRRQFEIRRRGYPYYGAIDTTQKNILAIAKLSLDETGQPSDFLNRRFTDPSGQERSVKEGFDANVDWVLARMSLNSEGLIESIHYNPLHHANQSWADSPDSFHHADGTLARHHPDQGYGVASVEVNAETYEALLAAIDVYQKILQTAPNEEHEVIQTKIEALRTKSDQLRTAIYENFWIKDERHHGGFFGRGTDRDSDGKISPLAIRSSDMGHLLDSGLLDDGDPRVVSLVKNLFSPEMLASNGIRTLSSDSVRYHPDAYHNGSVWPWDTFKIALGLERHGYHGLARELESRVLKFYQKTKTLAEYGSGDNAGSVNLTRQVRVFDPDLHPEPVDQFSSYNVIQPPQEIQAWTVATILAIKHRNNQRHLYPDTLPSTATDPAKQAIEKDILQQIKTDR